MPLGQMRATPHPVMCRVHHGAAAHDGANATPADVVADDFPLFVIDLFAFLVAEQQHRATEQEYGRSPAHAVRPTEFPNCPIACGEKENSFKIFDNNLKRLIFVY